MLLAGTALTLLPLAGVRAQSTDTLNPWLQCEADELAGDIVPATPDLPPLDEYVTPDLNLNDLDDLEGTVGLLTELGLI